MSESAELISISGQRWLCRSHEAEDATAWTVTHPVRISQAYELEDAPGQNREAPASSFGTSHHS